jgi:hypothetical protein
MSTHFKIDYNGWSEDSSPINKDVKVKTSHAKLISQTTNSNKAKEWRKKNYDKASEFGKIGGKLVGGSEDGKKRMAKIGEKYGKVYGGKFLPKDAGKKGKENLLKQIVCEKCNKSVNKGNYAKSHGKKCKELDKINLINLLPNKFTQSITKKIAEKNGIKNWKTLNIFHNTCPYTKCIIKVDKPNQFNPSWYVKNNKEINKVKNSCP